jgi:hypothetical protein
VNPTEKVLQEEGSLQGEAWENAPVSGRVIPFLYGDGRMRCPAKCLKIEMDGEVYYLHLYKHPGGISR